MDNSSLANLMAGANQAHAEGRLADCERMCRAILVKEPGNVAALVLAGIVEAKKGNVGAAVTLFQKAIAHDPACAPAYQWLSMAHRKLGQIELALQRAKDAVARNPNDPLAHHHLGLCHLDVEDYRTAQACFQRAASMAPNVAMVHYGIGLAQKGLNNYAAAIASFRQSARLDPASVPTLVALREALFDEGDAAGAAQTAKEVVRLQPRSAEANLWVARALTEVGKATEADTYVRQAMELEPDSALACSMLGSAYQVRGQLDQADAQFRKSIELLPEQGSAYLALVTNRKMTSADQPIVDAMRALADDARLSPLHASQLHYALGKASEDFGDYRSAMEHYDEANRISYRIKFGNRPFDARSLDSYEQLGRTYTAEFIERQKQSGSASDLPIFVVGMIRSGTTLAEQILSSHPLVGGAGEQKFWLESGPAALSGGGSRVDVEMLRRLSARYEHLLREIAPGKSHVVDKMPMNTMALGLIHIAFPKAKIIHICRHPVDTCLSIYATPNRTRLAWANDKVNIVLAYNAYLKLMDHWRSVLPTGALLDIRYEDIVANPESTIRTMIEFCNLDWNEACLRPDQNQRSVATPSVWQVRQPIYKTSVQRWKNFEPYLGPFASLT